MSEPKESSESSTPTAASPRVGSPLTNHEWQHRSPTNSRYQPSRASSISSIGGTLDTSTISAQKRLSTVRDTGQNGRQKQLLHGQIDVDVFFYSYIYIASTPNRPLWTAPSHLSPSLLRSQSPYKSRHIPGDPHQYTSCRPVFFPTLLGPDWIPVRSEGA